MNGVPLLGSRRPWVAPLIALVVTTGALFGYSVTRAGGLPPAGPGYTFLC
jgi:hypothetical protein